MCLGIAAMHHSKLQPQQAANIWTPSSVRRNCDFCVKKKVSGLVQKTTKHSWFYCDVQTFKYTRRYDAYDFVQVIRQKDQYVEDKIQPSTGSPLVAVIFFFLFFF